MVTKYTQSKIPQNIFCLHLRSEEELTSHLEMDAVRDSELKQLNLQQIFVNICNLKSNLALGDILNQTIILYNLIPVCSCYFNYIQLVSVLFADRSIYIERRLILG